MPGLQLALQLPRAQVWKPWLKLNPLASQAAEGGLAWDYLPWGHWGQLHSTAWRHEQRGGGEGATEIRRKLDPRILAKERESGSHTQWPPERHWLPGAGGGSFAQSHESLILLHYFCSFCCPARRTAQIGWASVGRSWISH